jgi:hypothetical protein
MVGRVELTGTGKEDALSGTQPRGIRSPCCEWMTFLQKQKTGTSS